MVLSKCFIVCVMFMGMSTWCSPAAHAQGHCAGGMCRHGMPHHQCLEVGCAPRSAFYNYYPTTWRRWPTDVTAAPTPAATPTPDASQSVPAEQEAEPQVQPEQPQLTPEEDTTLPGGPEAETTQPETQPKVPAEEEMLPFQDAPPELPGDSSNEPGLPGLPSSSTPVIPEDSPAEPSTPMEDAPPSMPDDNPFRDDPIQPESKEAAPMGQNDSAGPILSSHTSSDGHSWRSPARGGAPAKLVVQPLAKSLVAQEEQVAPSLASTYPIARELSVESCAVTADPTLTETSVLDEGPQLLPLGDEPIDELDEPVSPDTAPARRNPLRSASTDAGARPVVTAAWSVHEAKSAAPTSRSRRNPLRDN